MALMQLTIVPLGTRTASVGQEVAEVLAVLKREEIPFTLTDMGTIIEGPAPQLLELAARLHELSFSEKIQRVVTHITLDDRRDKKVHLGDKIASVEKHTATR
jgi:uncharacterized protein (TIGR00106 family)